MHIIDKFNFKVYNILASTEIPVGTAPNHESENPNVHHRDSAGPGVPATPRRRIQHRRRRRRAGHGRDLCRRVLHPQHADADRRPARLGLAHRPAPHLPTRRRELVSGVCLAPRWHRRRGPGSGRRGAHALFLRPPARDAPTPPVLTQQYPDGTRNHAGPIGQFTSFIYLHTNLDDCYCFLNEFSLRHLVISPW